jgi:hypothetical protein
MVFSESAVRSGLKSSSLAPPLLDFIREHLVLILDERENKEPDTTRA